MFPPSRDAASRDVALPKADAFALVPPEPVRETMTSSYAALATIVLPMGMICAALADLTTMRIPTGLIVLLCAGFLAASQVAGVSTQAMWFSLAVGLSVLLCMAALFALDLIGGGDAKLIAVAALWLGPDHVLPFLAYTALIGGVLALVLLTFRSLTLPSRLQARGWIARLHDPMSGIPYAIAVALAALTVFPDTHWASSLS